MEIYMDPSILKAIFLAINESQDHTYYFLKKAKLSKYKLYIANETLQEIENSEQDDKKLLLRKVINNYSIDILPTHPQTEQLKDKYIKETAIPFKYHPHTYHIALAVLHNIPTILSWDFENSIFKEKLTLAINNFNKSCNYPSIRILSPRDI